ncbi:recombinase family protein [Nocardioides sp. R-C-SC26]|uniref:recombinase family protein n=1 Tax=Nocardioides sp. R-C-SC26 TaxID=2870414 RepID=UPI001E2EC57B|nr:recombinase family protein [Nocardioides sp. R-C-SC26]
MNQQGARALIYVRVSKDDTGEGKSVQRQEEDCRKLAELRGWNVVRVETDNAISAYGKVARPGWSAVLEAIERGEVDVVIAWHLDRMTRNMLDLEELCLLAESKGVGVATVSGDIDLTTDVGRMVARILAAVARAEVERKAARQKRANQQRRAEGRNWSSGWAPFGYELDRETGLFVIVPEAAELVRQAASDVLDGKALRAVARDWAASGVSTPRNATGGWTHNAVRSVLTNPVHAGFVTYKGEIEGKGLWEPIITEGEHHQLTALLTSPERSRHGVPSRRGRRPHHLLTNIIKCSKCAKPMQGRVTSGKPSYSCPDYHVSVGREDADAQVRAVLAFTDLVMLHAVLPQVGEMESEGADALMTQISAAEQRQVKIAERWASGAIPDPAFDAANDALNVELEDLRARLAETEGSRRGAERIRELSRAHFDSLDLDGQRTVLESILDITAHVRDKSVRSAPLDQVISIFATQADGKPVRLYGEHPDARQREIELRTAWNAEQAENEPYRFRHLRSLNSD